LTHEQVQKEKMEKGVNEINKINRMLGKKEIKIETSMPSKN
jgi:hypothetical protein